MNRNQLQPSLVAFYNIRPGNRAILKGKDKGEVNKKLKLIDRLRATRWTPLITDKQTISMDW